MKVGVLQFFSWPERRVPLPTVYARALERIETMDASGYEAVWLAEHHFSGYSVCPSVHVVGAHVAARTRRLKIGTGVSLAALYQPLRLAEEVALLDVLSGGRVCWGAGRGFDATEFRSFGVPAEESAARFRENVAIVLAAWQNERLTFRGRWSQFEDVEVLPKPLQRPHPPVWLAASSPEAVAAAARDGFSILMDPHSPHDQIGEKRALWQRELVAAGHDANEREIPIARLLAVAETREAAREAAAAGARWLLRSYVKPGGARGGHDIRSFEARAAGAPQLTETRADEDPVERYLRDTVVWGTPDEVLDKLARLREEIALDYLLAAPLGHRSFELLTEKVLPRLG